MASDSKSIYKLISKDGTNPKQEFELTNTEIIIGRDPGADIILSTAVVSRRHARITRQGEDYIIEDLGSSNGTFVNNRKLDQPYALKSGDQISLGQTTRLIYEISPIRVFEPPSGIAETGIGQEIPIASLGSSAQLVVTIAGDNTRTYNLKQSEMSIGRAEDNHIVILSRIISGFHAVLNQVDNPYQITTIPGAKNPVYLNGRAISKPTILETREILRIGGRDPGVLCAQFYPKRHRIDIGICDMGRGIKASLQESIPIWGGHGSAISKALGRGVTLDKDIGQGNGLARTLEITRPNREDSCSGVVTRILRLRKMRIKAFNKFP